MLRGEGTVSVLALEAHAEARQGEVLSLALGSGGAQLSTLPG